MKLPKLNRNLLRRVLNHIKREPRRFNMEDWAQESNQTPCGTQACIAGWAYILNKGNSEGSRECAIKSSRFSFTAIHNSAQRSLGLTEDEADGLFLTYVNDKGKRGVKRAERKISELLKDREKFALKYKSIYERE